MAGFVVSSFLILFLPLPGIFCTPAGVPFVFRATCRVAGPLYYVQAHRAVHFSLATPVWRLPGRFALPVCFSSYVLYPVFPLLPYHGRSPPGAAAAAALLYPRFSIQAVVAGDTIRLMADVSMLPAVGCGIGAINRHSISAERVPVLFVG